MPQENFLIRSPLGTEQSHNALTGKWEQKVALDWSFQNSGGGAFSQINSIGVYGTTPTQGSFWVWIAGTYWRVNSNAQFVGIFDIAGSLAEGFLDYLYSPAGTYDHRLILSGMTTITTNAPYDIYQQWSNGTWVGTFIATYTGTETATFLSATLGRTNNVSTTGVSPFYRQVIGFATRTFTTVLAQNETLTIIWTFNWQNS